jgi:hypothetical protein
VITGTIAELRAALRSKRLSSVELTQGVLERIARLNPALNAFVTVDAHGALAAAKAADAARAAGAAGPLTGIPVAHKDVLMTAGLKTTCGSRMLSNFIAPYDAHVVDGLKRAGTILVVNGQQIVFSAWGLRRRINDHANVTRPIVAGICLEFYVGSRDRPEDGADRQIALGDPNKQTASAP